MKDTGFSRPVDRRYFEDYVPGATHTFGPVTVTEADIIEFAQRYDPQPFHTDPDAAKDSVYGGLIASGWHTAVLMMRQLVEHYLSSVASLGSPGIDELRWLHPVRPGDELSVRVTVSEARRSRSQPQRGIIHSFIEVFNQDDVTVMTMKAVNFILSREA